MYERAPAGSAATGIDAHTTGPWPDVRGFVLAPADGPALQQSPVPMYALAPPPHQVPTQVEATWGYPTAHGMVPLQPGATVAPAAHAPLVIPPPTRRRMRWETIIPAIAVVAFISAVVMFITDFDRITGREDAAPAAGQSTAPAETPVDDAAPTTAESAAPTTSAVELASEATRLYKLGRFAEASALLHPALEVEAPPAQLVKLHETIDAADARNTALLRQLARQRTAGKWSAVLRTIAQLEALRPLSKDLIAIRAQARAKVRAAQRPTSTATNGTAPGGTAAGGGAAAHSHAPAAGGNTASANTTKPPTTAPTNPGTMPTPPPIPNSGTGTGGVV